MTPPRLSVADRGLLALAALGVAIAAADTYVVVLALPEMGAAAGIETVDLQRAAPIISGFLLGYVAMLPLIGRVADLQGRVPVLAASLVIFTIGSGITALAYDLPSMVGGRFLQGVGGGGLVPVTMALVADLYPVHRRGLPLGMVSAVQEFGSVLGPVAGAAVLAVGTWRAIFVLNLVAGLVLLVAARLLARASAVPDHDRPQGRADVLSWLLIAIAVGAALLTLVRPSALVRDLFWGAVFVPEIGEGRWGSPVGLAAIAALLLLALRSVLARSPLIHARAWGAALRAADLPGALLLAIALAGVILAFGTGDPEIQVFSEQGHWYLVGTAVATVLLVVHLRRAENPLFPRGALRATPAWGGVLVSFLVGAALIAAVTGVPLFARNTIYVDSQVLASLVLVRLLAALPIGALAGGWLLRRLGAGVVAGSGMALAAVGFAWMSTWNSAALESWLANPPLVLTGLGFGLALAPVSAAVLATSSLDAHALASAMVVVSRMVGMLVGISALTSLGLRAFYAERDALPSPAEFCGGGAGGCKAYNALLRETALTQVQVVFLGAAVCAAIAAIAAIVLLRRAPTRGVPGVPTIG